MQFQNTDNVCSDVTNCVILILGSGNVASQLIKAFLKIDTVNLKQVYTRNQEDINTLKDSINTTNDISLLKQADVTIIAVSDDAISSISSSAFSANEILYWLLVNACVGNIENAREESIIPTENDAKSKPNTIIGDLVIIANSLEEGCYREVVFSQHDKRNNERKQLRKTIRFLHTTKSKMTQSTMN